MNARNGLRCVKEEMFRWNQLSVQLKKRSIANKQERPNTRFIDLLQALKSWMFHVKFIGLNREGTTEFYIYQVLWSIPTPAYPEPYVTVSVFFCIATSRVQPPHFPVDVSLLCIFSALSPCALSIFFPLPLFPACTLTTHRSARTSRSG